MSADSERSDYSELLLEPETVFKGKLLDVRRDLVRLPDGTTSVREYIVHPGAVMIIPLVRADAVLLEHQYRHPIGAHCYELPAGKKEPGEDPLKTAQRELEEETGYRARRWQHLGPMLPCVGYSSEVIDFFLAQDLHYIGAKPDHGEFLDVIELPIGQAYAWIQSGKINDVKTVAALLWLERLLAG